MSRIDYPLSQIKAVAFDIDGVLSPSTIPLGADGVPARMVNIKDGYALQLAVKQGLNIGIISGARVPSLRARYEGLGIKDVELGVEMKLPALRRWMQTLGVTPEETAFVGDDIPDFECLREVGLGVAPCDAAPEVKSVARYVSPVAGGYGVARDLLEQILKAKGRWMDSSAAFGW